MNASNETHQDRLPEPLGSIVETIAAAKPPEHETNSFVAILKQNRPSTDKPCNRKSPVPSRRRWVMACAATAAGLLLIINAVSNRSASAFEQLADALASKLCIKTTTSYQGQTTESWVMPALRQTASRSEQWIEHFDADAGTVMTYNRASGELVRSTRHPDRADFELQLIRALMAAAGREPALGSIRGAQIVSSKSQRSGNDTLLTLGLRTAASGESDGEDVIVSITMDAESHLPTRCVAAIPGRGQSMIEWSYPDEGPANIFALGVDSQTKLTDRVPSNEVKPILAGVYKGRITFDDYVAVTISSGHETPISVSPNDIVLFAKQADKLLFARFGDSTDALQGKSREQIAQMILSAPDKYEWHPLSIVDGSTEHRFSSRGVHSSEINLPREEFILASWHSIPHFAGRPALGIGRGDVESAVATEAENGPEGCVLLQTQRSGSIPEAPGAPDSNRQIEGGYWVRADRDYLVMQDDSAFEGERKYRFVLQELAQSPKGFWYPISAIHRTGDGNIIAAHYSYHLDFDHQLPENMFDPSNYLSQ